MIIKSFNLKDLNTKSDLFLFYGENEGHKEEIIKSYFLKEFDGEIIKYDENQILDNKNDFFETCLNESLFSNKKFILISRVTTKMYEIVTELLNKEIYNKKIIFNSAALEKKSKIRQLFEKEKKLVCVPFYEDNNATIRIIEMGKSPNLRHIKRMHDISLEWYHDCVRDGIFTIKYCPTHLQVADMMTKTTHDPSTWRSLLRLACLYPGVTPPPIPESYHGTGTTGRGDMIDDQGNIINVSKNVKRIRATPTHYN